MPEAAAAAADAAPPSITPSEATDKIEALISPKPPKRAKPEEEERPEAQAETPDAPAAGEPEEPPEEPASEEPEAPEADEDNAGAEGEEVLFTVKIDGRDVPVPVSEARDGYLRRTDYTQKTMALAQERQAFAEQIQYVQQQRQIYEVLLPALEQQIQQGMPQEPNWAALEAHPDKSHYWAARARWDETQRRLGAIAEEKDRAAELQRLDMVEHLNQHLEVARSWLTEQLPTWRDQKRAQADKAKLRDYALKAGFTEYDIDHAYDPRLVVLGHKARLYDELVANQPRPSTGSGPDHLKPGTATHEAPVQTRFTKAKRRLAQTGRPEDATAAIELLLARGL